MANYRVVLRKSEEGYSVSCPGLPGCWSQGATEEEAVANVKIAIREYVEAAEELAREDGVSLDIWVTSALAQKIGVVETAAEFFARRSAGAGKGLKHYLDMVPGGPPDTGDELPEGWTPR